MPLTNGKVGTIVVRCINGALTMDKAVPALSAVDMTVTSGDVELAVYRWGQSRKGKKTKPVIVLVHGYPDSASVWAATADLLAQDYQVVAYDVRGAGRSSRPQPTQAYELQHLVDDLAAVVDAVSPGKPVHLVGHDWGSIQSWEAVTTSRLQGRIASYTSISGPSLDHAGYWVMQRLTSSSPSEKAVLLKQLAHSWYIGAFHLPAVAPTLWKVAGDKLWPAILARVEGIRESLPNPTQSLDGEHGVKLYRANVTQRLRKPNERATDLPVQLIFPRGDHFMIEEIWDDLPRWAPNLWRCDVDAGHWLQVSHPELVADKVARFVAFVESGKEPADLQRARVRGQKPRGLHAGKLVLITGAGSGFGRETALAFAQAGADVIAMDINEEAAEHTATLCSNSNVTAWAKVVDVGNTRAMRTLATWVEKEFGAVDIVVNNAGIGLAGSFFDTSDADWDKLLKINLGGVIQGSRLFGAQMIATGRKGHIVNVASMGAFTPSRFMSAYNTSKAAVRMLSDCLRAELAEHEIHVATICPGLSITNITQSTRFVGVTDAEQQRKQSDATRLYQRRNLKPEAIAKAILKAVEDRRDEVPVGVEAHSSRLLSRLLPGVSRRLAQLDLEP